MSPPPPVRVYPFCCLSAQCGRLECAGCPNLPGLEEFKAWLFENNAVLTDPVWCPTVYTARPVVEHEIVSDGKTVWVNALDGSCVGRFSKFGMDVHHDVAEQLRLGRQCIDCTHSTPTLAEWERFRVRMADVGAMVSDDHMPAFLRPATAQENG